MEQTLEQLQKQLQERIEALDKQRKDESERFDREVAQRNQIAEADRKLRIEEHAKREEEHRQRRHKEIEEVENRKRETERVQREAEVARNKADEAKKEQEQKLEWLKREIANQEFIEEQHRKRVESTIVVRAEGHDETVAINVEHPAAPENKGNAVAGTEGATPETPLMSNHLKHILRQATRKY